MELLIKNISKSFGNELVVDSLSLKLESQEFVTLLGPSGCGKSTIFNIISGILTPDSGEIILNDQLITGKVGNISYMFQNHLLLPWKNTIDNISLPLKIQKQKKNVTRSQILNLMNDFGLENSHDKYPSQLSGGMRQRAALLRTYLMGKEVILLDEPFGALDTITRRKLGFWLLEIAEKFKLTILFITHDIEEAIVLSDRILVLSNRPAKLIKEFAVNFDKTNLSELFAQQHFVDLKKKIIKLL